VRTFSKIPEWEVRAITRNPASETARSLAATIPGIKVVKADLDDVKSLKAAFEGASAIFGVTDFWQFVPQYRSATQKALDQVKVQYNNEITATNTTTTWNEACFLREFQQGKNIIDAAAQVVASSIVEQGMPQLERLVLSSLSNARKASDGKYTWVYHFDSKAQFVKYLELKAGEGGLIYQALLSRTSFVQMGYYLDNWKMNPFFMPRKVRLFINLMAQRCLALLIAAIHNLAGSFVLTNKSLGRGRNHCLPVHHSFRDQHCKW
jgi:hypothetical protein